MNVVVARRDELEGHREVALLLGDRHDVHLLEQARGGGDLVRVNDVDERLEHRGRLDAAEVEAVHVVPDCARAEHSTFFDVLFEIQRLHVVPDWRGAGRKSVISVNAGGSTERGNDFAQRKQISIGHAASRGW